MAMDVDEEIAENPELTAIGIQFRLRPDSESLDQLLDDIEALKQEHPSQVCFTTNSLVVPTAANLIFR